MEGFSMHALRWIHTVGHKIHQGLDTGSNGAVLTGGPGPPTLENPSMDPRGGMSYQSYKTQVSHHRSQHAMRSGPQAVRPSAVTTQQNIRASSKSSSRPSPQGSSRPSPQSSSRLSSHSSSRLSSQSSSRPSPQSSSRLSPQSRPSPQGMRPGKPSPQNVRRSGGASRVVVTQSSLVHGSSHGASSTTSRHISHVSSTIHGQVQRQPPRHVQGQPGHLGYTQGTRSELFHFHSPPSSHTMTQPLEKRPIPSRASAPLGEMPLDLSKQAPVASVSSSSKGPAKVSSSSIDSPLDLSGKSSSPINLGRKGGNSSSTLINVQKCSFCNASFSTIPFLKMHLGKCPRKPKHLTNTDIDRWIENNFPEAIPSSSRGNEPSEKPKDDILDNLPRVNGAVALGTICIKEEPAEEDISIIDIEPIGKSMDKSVFKSSSKNSTTTSSSGNSASAVQAPQAPSGGFIKYGCIYCDNTYDKKEMLQDHIKTHSNQISSGSVTNSSQNTSRPVLTHAKQVSPQVETAKSGHKNTVEQAPVTSVSQSDSSKSPEPQPSGADTRRSATPTRSSEKKQTKRQTGNIMSIADNLLRRMTEKTQHTEKVDPAPADDAASKTDSPPEITASGKESEEKLHEETPVPESAEKSPESDPQEKQESPVSEGGEETEITSSKSSEPEVVEPEKSSNVDQIRSVKTAKSGKKSPEKPKPKGPAKSQKKPEKDVQKKPEKDVQKKPDEKTKSPQKVEEVRKSRESRKEAAQSKTEEVCDANKTEEGNKKKKTVESEKSETPAKTLKTPVKQPAKEETETRTRSEKKAKSPTRKAAKGEKLTREKVADIAKLALDLGCLRRSPRAAKAGADLPSPTGAVVAEREEQKAVTPSKKTKIAKPTEKISEPPATPSRKSSKRVLDVSSRAEPPAKRSKGVIAEEEKEEKEKVEDGDEMEEEKEEEVQVVSKAKGKAKGTKPVKKGKKGGKKQVEKGKKSEPAKKGSVQTIEKFFEKKSKSTKNVKSTGDVFKDHVAKMKPKRNQSKTKEKGKEEEKQKEKEVPEEACPPSLEDVEMEAVEELIKLSQGKSHDKSEKKKESRETVTSDSQNKIDDVYNRHVAAIKGKITKKGRNKKKKHKVKVAEMSEEPEKMPRIVGRKAYKEWLESQATVKDKSSDISKKQRELDTETSKPSSEKKKKRYEDDDDDYVLDLQDENDMDNISDIDDKDGPDDRNWEPEMKSPKFSGSEEFDLECSKCKGAVTGRKDFNKHMLCHSPANMNPNSEAKIFSCPVCAQEFRNKNRCWGHMVREHAGLKSFHECPYCFKKYSRRDAVQVHVASVHPKERRRELAEKNGWQQKEEEEEEEFKDEDVDVDLTCKRCNRPIQNKADCYTHIMLHSPRGKRKVCPLCDKTSRDSSRVWEHVMVEHAGIKPFGCDQCAYRCAHEESLKRHIQTYHGKFLDPVARVKMDFESENWDLGINPSYLQEPQGPLPLSSGNVISLIDLSLNTLIINQRTKVMNLNLLLSSQNIDLRTIINEALHNGMSAPVDSNSASTSKTRDKSTPDDTIKEKNNNKDDDEESDDDMDDRADQEEGIYPDDPAVIASKAMIPADCINMELPCVLCPMGVKGADEFKLHVLKHICDSTRICPVCRRAFSRKSSCRRHLVEHTFKWRHKCNLCSQTFPKSQYLEKHYTKHVEQGFQCLNCLGKFNGEEDLWMHIHPSRPLALRETPLGAADNVKFSCRRVHVCEKCHQEFRSAWGLQYHRENTHSEGLVEEEKPYMCMTCGKRFKSNITLRNHQEIHVEDCSYLCRHCGLTCRTKRQLQKHIEYKHMEKIYKCSYCPKMFATRSRLKEHAIMHQNKTFICDICGKVYRHQRVFETHCRQHIKPPVKKHRLFPCPQCSHQSKSKEQLNLHMRRHTGERPYKCKECPKAFSSQTGLWRHQMSHAGRKPHECHLCKKSFVQKCSLDRHLLSHAGIKPYRCEYCGAEYSQSYPLTKHMEKKHPGMPFIIIKKDVDPVVIEPRGQRRPEEAMAEVAAEAAKRATTEAINEIPGVTPTGNVVKPVPATVHLDSARSGDDEEEEEKEFLSV